MKNLILIFSLLFASCIDEFINAIEQMETSSSNSINNCVSMNSNLQCNLEFACNERGPSAYLYVQDYSDYLLFENYIDLTIRFPLSESRSLYGFNLRTCPVYYEIALSSINGYLSENIYSPYLILDFKENTSFISLNTSRISSILECK